MQCLAAASAERKLHPQDRDVVAEVQVRNEKRARRWVTTRYVVGSGVKPKYSDHVRLTRDVGSAHTCQIVAKLEQNRGDVFLLQQV